MNTKIECRISRIYGPGRTSHRVRITIPRGIELFNGCKKCAFIYNNETEKINIVPVADDSINLNVRAIDRSKGCTRITIPGLFIKRLNIKLTSHFITLEIDDNNTITINPVVTGYHCIICEKFVDANTEPIKNGKYLCDECISLIRNI